LYVTKGFLGQYFFGYQLTTQITALLAVNLQYVLLPVLSRLASDPARQATAFLRTVRVLILVVSPMSLALALVIGPLETLVWHHKWAAAVPLMQVFATAAPLRLFTTIVHAVLTSRGQFRVVAWLTLLEGLVLMASAWLAYLAVGANLTGLAIGIGSTQVLFNVGLSLYYTRRWGIGTGDFLAALSPGWIIAVVTAAGVLALTPTSLGWHPIGEISVRLFAFSLLYLVATRTFCAAQLSELIAVMPNRIASVLARVLAIKREAR
jgi:O-antigen/teichoic acid export membrane protein